MTVEQRARSLGVHLVLIAYSALAVGPLLLVVMNSFKTRSAIFGAPLAPPDASTERTVPTVTPSMIANSAEHTTATATTRHGLTVLQMCSVMLIENAV